MIALIAPSDFASGKYRIPNAVSLNAGEGINADLQDVLNSSVYDLLMECLGPDQYAELDAVSDINLADQKWQDFVTGKGTYKGIKEVLLPYVFCNWLQYDNVTHSTVGGSKPQTVGAATASLAGKYVRSWNEFVDLYQSDHPAFYPAHAEVGSHADSLYEFMTKEPFDVTYFRFYNYENRFGL